MSSSGEKSKAEAVKEMSQHLRGTIGQELSQEGPNFNPDNVQLLKFHGMYQQDDRDTRKDLLKQKKGRDYSLMIRTRVPGGILTAPQFKTLLEIAETIAQYGTLRITTRQTIQIHGVLKKNIKSTIKKINDVLLTTLGACGDVERNITTCPAPFKDPFRQNNRIMAQKLATHFASKSHAYHEIWLDGKRADLQREVEPLYGENYLPRKFKTCLGLLEDNCIDIYAHDMGLVPLVHNNSIKAYNLLVGGGFGRKPARQDTFPRLASPIGSFPADKILSVMTEVIKIFKEYGNRTDRDQARIKYLIHNWGVDRFRETLEKKLGFRLAPFEEMPHLHIEDHLGWLDLGEGEWAYGIYVPNGRIANTETVRYKDFFKEIIQQPGLSFYNTAEQKIIVAGLKDKDHSSWESRLKNYGLTPADDLNYFQRHVMACPALPTCGLAVAESERVIIPFAEKINALLKSMKLDHEEITLRMTGCPNGCSRPYNAVIGVVGKTLNKYDLYLGGHPAGTRLAHPYLQTKTLEEIKGALKTLFKEYRQDPSAQKNLADFLEAQI